MTHVYTDIEVSCVELMQLHVYTHVVNFHVLTTIPQTFPRCQSICNRGQHCPSAVRPSQSQAYHPEHLQREKG